MKHLLTAIYNLFDTTTTTVLDSEGSSNSAPPSESSNPEKTQVVDSANRRILTCHFLAVPALCLNLNLLLVRSRKNLAQLTSFEYESAVVSYRSCEQIEQLIFEHTA
jgi:hypothetical protein